MCVNYSRESVVWPAWFHLPGGVVAGWRWCVRSELGRWCSCPWCCPADSSAGALWDWPPWRESPGLWTPTTTPAPTPVWCHWTDSEDPVGGGECHTDNRRHNTNKTSIYEQALIYIHSGIIHTDIARVFIYSYSECITEFFVKNGLGIWSLDFSANELWA